MEYIDITPNMTSESQVIDGRAYTLKADSSYYSQWPPHKALEYGNGVWISDYASKPHWYLLDFGSRAVLSGIKFVIRDDEVSITVKDFHIDISDDDVTYTTVYNGTNTNSTVGSNPVMKCNFDKLVVCRYVKLVFTSTYDTRGYKWTQIGNLCFYGRLSPGNTLYTTGVGVYSVVSGTFQKVADDWTALTDAQKIALFKATNYETATPEQLATLGKFRIVTYAEDNTQPSCVVTALPKDQIVLPKELISTKAFENVDSITPTVTNNTTTAKVRFFLTNDLKTYYVYNSTTKAFDVIDATNSDTLLTSGMNASDFTGIDTTALNTFISKNVGIGIGFVLSSTTISDLTTVDNLAIQVDMKGSWNHATYGTDVTYGYINNDVLTVTLVTANSFKINYQE